MKQLSENVWEFDPQIYPQLLWIAVNPTEEEQQKLFTTTYDDPEEDLKADMTSCYAVVYDVRFKENGRTGSIIVFKDSEQIKFSHVAHEASHVVMNLCSVCNIKTHYDNQEPIAYLIGWVAECCEKIKKEYDNRD